MNEMVAAVGVAQLRKLEGIKSHCRALRQRLFRQIEGLSNIGFRRIPDPTGDTAFESYLFLPSEAELKEFTARLDARNIHCARMTGTYCHYHRPYCEERLTYVEAGSPFAKFDVWPAKGYRAVDFPRTENIVGRLLALPIGVFYTEEDVDYMAAMVKEVHADLGRVDEFAEIV